MATAKIQTVKGLRVEIFSRTLRKNTTRPLTVWIVGTALGAGPVGIASLVCPAGHGVLRAGAGVGPLESMKKQGAGFRPPVSCVLAVLLGLVLESVVRGRFLFPYL